jgi:uncharacterized membrane protein
MLELATSVQTPDTLSFYNVVVFVHISAAIVAFGVTFAYPIVDAILHRPGNLQHLAWWHRAQHEVGQKLITGAATVLLVAGLYLAAAGPYGFGKQFVTLGMVIIAALLGLGGAFFSPNERKAAELVERDIAASAGGEVQLSAEYDAVARRLKIAGAASGFLVLAAVFLMVMKPS